MIADLRNLPDAVLNRLEAAPGRAGRDGSRPGLDVVVHGVAGGTARAEQRHRHDSDLGVTRADHDELTARHVGYAYVSEISYDVYGGPPYGFTETIAAGAAMGCLRDDVRYLLNHSGMPLARTRSGTLVIDEDDTGLHNDATVDLRITIATDLTIAIERHDIDQMSFSFRVARQEWNDDYTERRILEFEELFDTSTVTFPASPTTLVKIGRDGVVQSDDDQIRRAFEYQKALIGLDL